MSKQAKILKIKNQIVTKWDLNFLSYLQATSYMSCIWIEIFHIMNFRKHNILHNAQNKSTIGKWMKEWWLKITK